MSRVWRGLVVLAGLWTVYEQVLRPRLLRWGASDDELALNLPGDSHVPRPRLGYTRAITIDATPAAIWPWLVQIGYGRAGWYSYDGLEAALGAADFVDGPESARRIVPELQDLAEGDLIRIAPEPAPGFHVLRIDPERVLVLIEDEKAPDAVADTRIVWSFVLQPLADEAGGASTRLIVRQRLSYAPTLLNTLVWRVITEPGNFLMENKMLRGLKQRAEWRG